jgi:cell wall-associated NlpC family hydrolase
MLKRLTPFIALIVTLASCSSLKPLNFTSSKPVATPATRNYEASTAPATSKKEVKFLNDISVQQDASTTKEEAVATKTTKATTSGPAPVIENYGNRNSSVEKASALQLKYSVLLNTEVEQLENSVLLEHVDEWYGTKYRMGGTSKSGIDCSAFVQAVYLSAFAVSLPRTARDQYRTSHIISATELKEGDLVFFNTRGGVSHVGIYLQNNKFIHASSSQGVTVSDMFDPYYLKRYIGAGRIDKPDASVK